MRSRSRIDSRGEIDCRGERVQFRLLSKIANRCLADAQKDRRLGDGFYIGRQTVRAQPYAHEHASGGKCARARARACVCVDCG